MFALLVSAACAGPSATPASSSTPGRRVPPIHPPCHPRYHARGCRRSRGRRHRDAVVQRGCREGSSFQTGVRGRAGDTAVARDDADGGVPGQPRHPRERAISVGQTAARHRASSARPATGRPPSCRRSSSTVASASHAASTHMTTRGPAVWPSVTTRTRPMPRSPSWRKPPANSRPLFVWVHLFDPHAPVRPSGAVPRALRRQTVSRRGGGDGRTTRSPRRGVRRAGEGPGRGPACWRSRRGPWRARRGAARRTALSVDDESAARDDGPGSDRGRERRAGEHATCLPHAARLGGHRLVAEPARHGFRSGDGRGDEAIPRIRLAAAGDDGEGPAQGDSRWAHRNVRRRGGPGRGARPGGRCEGARAAAAGHSRLSGTVAGRLAAAGESR